MLQPRLPRAQWLPFRSTRHISQCVGTQSRQWHAQRPQFASAAAVHLRFKKEGPAWFGERKEIWDSPSRRWFTTGRNLQAMSTKIDKGLLRKIPKQPSPKGQAKQQMIDAETLPNDLGLFPDTFIMPTGTNLPGWFSEPKMRWMLETSRIARKGKDFATLIYYKFFLLGWRYKPRPELYKFPRSKLPNMAKELHSEVFTAFSEANEAVLKEKCCEGILAQLKARIAQRSHSERMTWEAKYKSGMFGARVVSDRAVPLSLPGIKIPPGSSMRQVVVRIKSEQTLTRWDVRPRVVAVPKRADRRNGPKTVAPISAGEPEDEGPVVENQVTKQKSTIEYVVMQRRMLDYKWGPWMLWGMTQETEPESLLPASERQQFRTS